MEPSFSLEIIFLIWQLSPSIVNEYDELEDNKSMAEL